MGEVVQFPGVVRVWPQKRPREAVPPCGGDLYRLAQIAALSVFISVLSRLSADVEVVFQGERMLASRAKVHVGGMLEDRDALFAGLGRGGDVRVMSRCAAAFRLSEA